MIAVVGRRACPENRANCLPVLQGITVNRGAIACYDSYDGYGYDSSAEVSAEAKPGAAAAAGQVGSTI
jgi:hypothetical protein